MRPMSSNLARSALSATSRPRAGALWSCPCSGCGFHTSIRSNLYYHLAYDHHIWVRGADFDLDMALELIFGCEFCEQWVERHSAGGYLNQANAGVIEDSLEFSDTFRHMEGTHALLEGTLQAQV